MVKFEGDEKYKHPGVAVSNHHRFGTLRLCALFGIKEFHDPSQAAFQASINQSTTTDEAS
jgi:hypothetical protein